MLSAFLLLTFHQLLGIDQAKVELTVQDKKAAVESAAALLEAQYVFPKDGKSMSDLILRQLKEGKYDAVHEASAFASVLTKDLKSVNGDQHLSVDFWEKPIQMPTGGPDAEWLKERVKVLKHFNGAVNKVERLAGNVGYLKIDGFYQTEASGGPIASARAFLSNTDALLIDLRDNGGGVNESVQLLASYFFKEPTEISRYYDRPTDKTVQFWTMPFISGDRYLDKPVYILVGPETASGAEGFAYALQALKRGTIVGKRTWGGAHGATTHKIQDHLMLVLPDGRSYNPVTGKDWEGTGVQPDVDCRPEEALNSAYKSALKTLLAQVTVERYRTEIQEALTNLPPATKQK